MQKINILIVLIATTLSVSAQNSLPDDYLTKEFHAGRRDALRKLMPANSVTVVFAYPERVFSRDVNYPYHQNPDLYYFTGYKEPDAVLLIFKEDQHRGDTAYNELFFVRKRNALQEQWTGRRLGAEGVQQKLGFKYAYTSDEFKNYPVDFTKFSNIFYDNLPDDLGSGTMGSLVKAFTEKAHITKPDNKYIAQAYSMLVNSTTPSNLAARIKRIKTGMSTVDDSEYKNDPLLLQLVNQPDSATLADVVRKIKEHPSPSFGYNQLVASLREIKTPEELALLRKSVTLSAVAHAEVMRAINEEMSETEIEGMFEYVHKKYGAEAEGYPPIVGAGANGCILHYIENNVTRVDNQLVLMDVASEYHGYSADITRTIPANGKFTSDQKAIYDLVYNAQEAVFPLCKEGTPFSSLNEKATEVLAEGLLDLGIIKDKKDVSLYYIHGCSHHMGLDVHDKSVTPVLQQNMVITVEPGIYIPKGSPCDPKWWDIAVRIEDDVVIGKADCEILSKAAPRKASDVEAMTAKKSPFNNMSFPSLK
ncbi:MAG TPA: aminopeptidase P family protein [Panacibacter sp.]|nr:aminopeptidase P family protein [Panacibacter sp.]HNP43625.1 aminopeptidase P family protein [Panacibacter sp.]